MDWDDFCNFLEGELPLNRKERFYTGTVLPALLFHNGLSNFYTFLRQIKGFPLEINEAATKDYFLFYTEYNLKESAGERNVGRKIYAPTNETPDVVIEILKPVKVFIIIEAKMFAKVSQEELTKQIKKQKDIITVALKNELGGDKFYHLALVSEKLQIKDTAEYQVANWEFFIDNDDLDVQHNVFYNYLRFAIENYDKLVSITVGGGPPSTVEFYMKGQALYELEEESQDFWIGRRGGEDKIIEDAKSSKWQKHKYCVNSIKPLKGKPGNWIPFVKFVELIDTYHQ